MSIYPEKRKGLATGRLVVEVQRNHKTIKKFVSTRKDAVKLEAEIKAGLHDAGAPLAISHAVNHGDMLLTEFAKKARLLWNGDKDEKQSVARLEKFMGTLKTVMEQEGITPTLKAVHRRHITATVDAIKAAGKGRGGQKGLKDGTLNRYVSAGSKAFSWALDEELIEAMPKFPWKDEGKPQTFFLTDDAEKKQRDILTAQGHADCLLLMDAQLASGCRISELLKRKPSDYTKGEDGIYVVTLPDTKNGDPRLVCMPGETGDAMIALMKKGMPSYRSVWRRIKKARVKAGLPTTQPTHAHRHTTATRLAADGANSLLLADYMGHKSIATTKRYVHNDTTGKKLMLKKLLGMSQ